MATLKAMFSLFDGYSSTIDKINKKTDQATTKILNASGSTDKFNTKLNATGVSANTASSGLSKFISVAALLAGAVKGMNIVDEFINTGARLDLINDGLQTQAELQDKIFAAADRSKGAYANMASAISKMGLLAKDQFKTNDELINFTELLQKSFKVGGASQMEQSSAMLQLSQAMASGRLQGDEFRSIMENAPMLADAIAKYTGKSKGKLKEMSAEGTITADIIKNSMFAAADDINTKFKSMPMTFADVWNKIKNAGTKAFSGVMQSVNKLINTDGFQTFLNNVIIGFNLAAQAAEWLINAIADGWDTIGPILGIIGGALLLKIIVSLWSMVTAILAQGAAWLIAYWPLLLVIGIIAIAISAARQMGATWEQIFGFIGGIVGVFVGVFYNYFVYIWNAVAAFINFFGNVFKNPVASVKALFYDLMVNVLGFFEQIAKGIETLLNKIPGVKVNITSGITKLKDNLASKSSSIKNEADLKTYVKSKDFMDYSTAATKGSDIGKSAYTNFNKTISNLTSSFTKDEDKPLTVQGTGGNGSLKVDMSDEDLQYLRDIAERDYINKFSTATLAPNIQVSFGDVHEEADVDKLHGRITKILKEEIAIAAEGAYA